MAEQTLLQSPELDLKKHDGYSYSTHRSVTVEPALFLVAVAMSLSGAVVMQLFLVRSCEVTLSVNMSTCDLLVGHPDLPEAQQVELEAQPHAAVLQMAKMLTEACVPAILSMFLGPWSDMHGRKPLLVWPMLGYSAMFWAYAGLSMVRGLPPHYLLLASLPVALSGGFVSIISSAFAFMSDITAPDQRASRMGLLDAGLFSGFLVGTYGSAHLFSLAGRFGYVAVFSTCASCCLAAYLYIFFSIEDSVNTNQIEGSTRGLVGLFDWHLFVNMMQTCCKKRECYRRAIIFLIIVAISSSVITMEGEVAVVFLFTRKKFEWDIHRHTTFSTVSMLVTVVGTVLGSTLLSSWLQLPDDIFLMIAFFTKTVSVAIFAAAPSNWLMYFGCIFGLFGGVTGPLGRSILSKTVPKQDVGTVFSLASLTQSLMPLAAAPLYTVVYNATLLNFPAAFFVLSTAILGLDFILVITVFAIQQRYLEKEPQEMPMMEINFEAQKQYVGINHNQNPHL